MYLNYLSRLQSPRPKDPARQAVGWNNRRNGLKLEEIIANACELYAEREIALIEKTPEPMKPIKSRGGGKFVAIFEGKAQCDYKGTLKGGQAIAFEAKSTQDGRIFQRVVTEKQTELLRLHEKLGARCYVVVSLLNGMSFYRVPWSVWTDMKELFGHKYMNADELRPYEIQPQLHNGKVCLMFLEDE